MPISDFPQNCTSHLHLNINTFKQSSSEHPNPQWLPPAGSKTPHLGFQKNVGTENWTPKLCWDGSPHADSCEMQSLSPMLDAQKVSQRHRIPFSSFESIPLCRRRVAIPIKTAGHGLQNPERELCVDSDYNERYLNTLKFDLIVDHSFHRQKSKYLSHLGLLHKTQTTISSWISEHSKHAKKDPRPPRPMPTPPTTSKRQSELDSRRPWLGFLGRNSSVWEKK